MDNEDKQCFLTVEDDSWNKILEITYDGEIYLNGVLIASDSKLKQIVSKCDLESKRNQTTIKL